MSLLSKFLVVVGALLIPLSYYVHTRRSIHSKLSQQLIHRSEVGESQPFSRNGKDVISLSSKLIQNEAQYVVLFDEAVKTIPLSTLAGTTERRILTTYVRHNFGNFASLPQAWILWALASKDLKRTFDPNWINGLEFEKGDQVCGDYNVVYRKDTQVEMSMSMGQPESPEYIEARLVVSIATSKKLGTATFKTRTFMWRLKDSAILMPLERSLPKWLHEAASWWMIDEGINHLQSLSADEI